MSHIQSCLHLVSWPIAQLDSGEWCLSKSTHGIKTTNLAGVPFKKKNDFALCRMNFKPVSASEWWEVVVRMFNAFLAFIGWCQCDNRPNVSNVWKYWDLRDNVASVSCINNLYRRQQGPVSLYQHGISFICTGSRETQTNNCNCLPRTPKVLAERAAKYRKIIDLQRGQKQGMLKKEEAMEHQRNRWIDES